MLRHVFHVKLYLLPQHGMCILAYPLILTYDPHVCKCLLSLGRCGLQWCVSDISHVLFWCRKYYHRTSIFPLCNRKVFSALCAHRCTRATTSSHVLYHLHIYVEFSAARLPQCFVQVHWAMKPQCSFPLTSHVKYRFDQSDCWLYVAGFAIHDDKLYHAGHKCDEVKHSPCFRRHCTAIHKFAIQLFMFTLYHLRHW